MPETTATTAEKQQQKGAEQSGAAILVENVTKRYGGGKKPAVDHLTLEIPRGKIVMFVGPSGCGKTTTLKMLNRLIEPTEGRIVINDQDVTRMNGDKLRRKIGYVIQAGGLLPHLTVAANIGMVPKMLKWDRKKIAARVDELLDLVSLDPEVYRDRYPKELSGGQQQRVGVARALAADPPVLLMDEPFGAVDPITRQRLQDELINIQEELQKTIVMVTHDFDEAVKLGDWIAVFDEGAHIVQYDTPEAIIANPANEFVENFIGSGAGLKQLNFARVNEVELGSAVEGRPGQDARELLDLLAKSRQRNAVILDERRRPVNWYSREQLERVGTVSGQAKDDLPLVNSRSTLNDALDEMLQASTAQAVVVSQRGQYQGVISVDTVIEAIREIRTSAVDNDDAPVGHNTGEIPVVAARDDVSAREDSGGADGAVGGDGAPSAGSRTPGAPERTDQATETDRTDALRGAASEVGTTDETPSGSRRSATEPWNTGEEQS